MQEHCASQEHRAAIVVTGIGDAWVQDVSALRLGAEPLVARVIVALAPLVGAILLVPLAGRRAPRLAPPLGRRVTLVRAEADLDRAGRALAEAAAHLPPEATTIVALTGDMPLLTPACIDPLCRALEREPGDGVVWAARGEAGSALLVAMRRAALVKAAPRLRQGESPERVFEAQRCASASLGVAGNGHPTDALLAVRNPAGLRRTLVTLGLSDPAKPAVTLEVYGQLRLTTGCAAFPLHAETVGAALAALRRIDPEAARGLGEDGAWIEHFRCAINGQQIIVDPDHPLRTGDRLVLFSAAVGG
ncbi:MAG: NTP transferase domain-containing protein [Candidatus Lambdaproteobacteria bacterium]|nr:NTP transferase domain-containing protein [Candidatus Lambdaproteobacteria bacterium]